MRGQPRYKAELVVDGEPLMKISNNDKDMLVAQAAAVLESEIKDATCQISDTRQGEVIQTMQRHATE